ncbi:MULTISPECIES: hypothetical protein [unclassified Janthinobacterium]|uniref:hypothetical protein n=1 Tax=unclassified Janthinobacterium TaxID=2610881 RepID=UPI00160FC095|nr:MULTISPECIES: hypothetical protein [unclassified Janthinobacterium]MBB5369063.1 hypothetical protein [Janthinobacterium sp. K2C7]MBB5381400.1 hypothetical protein [Janthinobacterium sp. K2Li3]MBB5387446.1 hypothetical protein [Janthinobacterium sp. K2E3]
MSQLPALVPGTRQNAANTVAGQGQQAPKAGSNLANFAGSPLMQRTTQDVVALSKNGLDLSAKGLSQRTDALGNATVDAAQDFLKNMTQKMFGDGASISFDSVDLQAASGFSSGAASVSGASGTSQAAAFSLDENAHFIGKGKITTADGQTFDFEVEVQYQSNISAGALQQTPADAPDTDKPDDTTLPTKQLPATNFAGNLNDLFKLLGQQLQSNIFHGNQDTASASSKDGDQAGSLTLRLLNLVQPAKTAEADKSETKSDAQARAVAAAYGADDKPAPPAISQAQA